eukprot:8098442-Pyramimonas_sp.AAC.1
MEKDGHTNDVMVAAWNKAKSMPVFEIRAKPEGGQRGQSGHFDRLGPPHQTVELLGEAPHQGFHRRHHEQGRPLGRQLGR